MKLVNGDTLAIVKDSVGVCQCVWVCRCVCVCVCVPGTTEYAFSAYIYIYKYRVADLCYAFTQDTHSSSIYANDIHNIYIAPIHYTLLHTPPHYTQRPTTQYTSMCTTNTLHTLHHTTKRDTSECHQSTINTVHVLSCQYVVFCFLLLAAKIICTSAYFTDVQYCTRR